MEIKIRNVEPATVKRIDEWAKQKGVSRQEYLKEHLETFAVSHLHSSLLDRYEKQLQVNTMVLERNAEKMEALMEIFTELMLDE